MKEIKHDYKCDGCGKPAVYNLQRNWHLYDITPEGYFQSNDEWNDDENSFYCEECYEKEMSLTN